jgi:hypothetical protein
MQLRIFGRWLWSDWGRPNFFTKLGLPRILTNLFFYIAYPFLIYYVMSRFLTGRDSIALSDFLHNPFILSAYGAFFAVDVIKEFLDTKYSLRSLTPSEEFRSIRTNLNDPFVRIFLVAVSAFLVCLVIGGFQLQFRSR